MIFIIVLVFLAQSECEHPSSIESVFRFSVLGLSGTCWREGSPFFGREYQMMDSFFNRGFKAAKCKTALKLTIPRIKLLRNKREVQLKQMRREIAQLLQSGQELTARIRVEHIIREQNIMDAYEIIELFCELVAVRLPIIETQRECPLDLKEAIASLCFAAPRCSDLSELLQIQSMFAAKYGKEFVASASELRPDCGVNRQIIEKLSVRAPLAEAKLKLLKEIAEEHQVEWDASATEAEFSKLHEDLLDGPSQFLSGSTVPFPEGNFQSYSSSGNSNSASDGDLDGFSLPSVPKEAVPGSVASERKVEVPPLQDDFSLPTVRKRAVSESVDSQGKLQMLPLQSHSVNVIDEGTRSHGIDDTLPYFQPLGSDLQAKNIDQIAGLKDISPSVSDSSTKMEQFIPFVSAPPPKSPINEVTCTVPPSPPSSEHNLEHLPRETIERKIDLKDAKLASQNRSTDKISTPVVSSEESKDLRDVLAAAQAAATSADRAAAAARAAAELAKVRISEMIKNTDTRTVTDDECSSLFDVNEKLSPSVIEPMSNEGLKNMIHTEENLTSRGHHDDIFDLNLESSERRKREDLGLDIYQLATDRAKDESSGETQYGSFSQSRSSFKESQALGESRYDSFVQSSIKESKKFGETHFGSLHQNESSTSKPTLENQASGDTRDMRQSMSFEDDSDYPYPNLFHSHNSST
eukprot:TRINITY_DN3382_c0_g1_i1.p1 TRINITY_DN3382_c0_g1~~TRINITY_DN3382_c0_g1_i1.p1  ORF type:complete len:693 (-),score=175.94 TRINITY_DN3382_c0_g1_i1:439-2517(-)